MQFNKRQRRAPVEYTARMAAAYVRSCKTKQDKLPLFAAQIAETQLSPQEAEAQRRETPGRYEKQSRDQRAASWREIRARLFALPPHARRAVVDGYHNNRWYPRDPGFLASLVWNALRAVEVSPQDVTPPPAPERAALIAALNDRARAHDTFTRRRFAYSPEVMDFLCPDFEPDEDHARPRLFVHTNMGWFSGITDRVSRYADWGHNSDPTGERRAGAFDYLGRAFRFEIVTVSHRDNAPSAAPWNLDLSRRIVWIGREGEALDLARATYNGGWRPEGSGVDDQHL